MPYLIAALMVTVSGPAFANGGGPLLLFLNAFAFAFGSVAIVVIEALVYRFKANISYSNAFKDSFIVNLISTILVGLGLAYLTAVTGSILARSFPEHQVFFRAVGTVLIDPSIHWGYTLFFFYYWLIVSYFLTVLLERALLRVRWKKRNEASLNSLSKACWLGNSITYLLLTIALSVLLAL